MIRTSYTQKESACVSVLNQWLRDYKQIKQSSMKNPKQLEPFRIFFMPQRIFSFRFGTGNTFRKALKDNY